MKNVTSILLVLITLFCVGNAAAQKKKSKMWKLHEKYLKIEFKIPKSWWADGFGGGEDDWDGYGSSVCECTGIIVGTDNPDIKMVYYPMKKGLDPERRNFVWDYKFVPAETKDKISNKYLEFEREISKWEEDEDNFEVWRLIAKKGDYSYYVYLWAKPSVMKKKEKLLMQIVDTFKPL